MSCKTTYDPCLDGKLNQIGSYSAAARYAATQSEASATQSANSATASATSAANSAASATQASNYLTQVTNIFEDFDERYLGSKAVAPTVDNQGNPLQEGAMYWNSVANSLYVWNGSVWVALPTGFNEFTNFLATGTTFARNLVTRAVDVVNVKDFGAVGDGVTDDTVAIQAALNYLQGSLTSSRKSVFFPRGRYNFTELILPVAYFYCIYGEGTSSVLVQKGNGIRYTPIPTFCHDLHATIRNLHFDGTDGTGNTLDLSFSQTTDVVDVYFTNVPENYSSLKLDGNTIDGTYCHDFRVRGIRIYNRFDYTKQGFAGIHLGSRVSDSLITDFVMQGYFYVDYCLFAAAGALTTCIADSHPFNASKNVIRLDGGNTDMSFTNCVFDFSGEDMVYIKNTSDTRFVNCHFQVKNDWGVTLDNSYNTTFIQSKFNPLGLPIDGFVREINISGSGNNRVIFSQIQNPNLATNLFSLNSPTSYNTGTLYHGTAPANFPTQTFYGSVYSLTGATQIAHPQNATRYLGQNGMQTSGDDTNWPVPMDGYIKSVRIDVSATPVVGQVYEFYLYNGPTLLASAGTISNGQFTTIITPTNSTLASVLRGDRLYIISIFSATSGPAHVRYSAILTG